MCGNTPVVGKLDQRSFSMSYYLSGNYIYIFKKNLFDTFLTSTARLVRIQGRWSWGRGALDPPPSHFSRGKMFCFSIIKVHAVSTRRTCYFRPYPGWVYVKNTISEPLVFTGPVWTQYRLNFCTAGRGCMVAWQHSWKTSFWIHSRPQSHSA